MRPFLLSLTMYFLSLLNSSADSIAVSGSVSGEWDVDTVLIMEDIIVNEGDGLFIHPGVRVEFQGSYSFYVGGYIRALGTGSDRIIFDVADTTGFAVDTIPDGGWNGLQFYYTHQSVDSSIFEFCSFKHGKAVSGDTLENHGGVFCIRYFDKVRISNCIFQDNIAALNGGAVYLDESDIVLENNWFFSNSCGPADFPWGYGGAICSDNSDPLVLNNEFESNASTGVGGAVAIRYRDVLIHNNVFTGNYSGLGGAIGYLHYYEYPHSQCNNLLYGNSSEFFGGGIACIDAGPTLVNNTLTGNFSAYGGAFYVKDSIVPNVYNSILYGNDAAVGPEVYLWDAYASANFYYCDVEGGPELFGGSGGGAGYVGEYENNLDTIPMFIDPSSHYYRLDLYSPCLNAGTPDTAGLHLPEGDLDGSPRIDYIFLAIDMGCYEEQYVGINSNIRRMGSALSVYPNPATKKITIESTSIIRKVELTGLSGKLIWRREHDNNPMIIPTDDLGNGIYLILVYTADGLVTGKVMIRK